MIITKHAMDRFKERVTWDTNEAIRCFISTDIRKSEVLYRVNCTEKRLVNGIIYVVDCSNPYELKVITLYLEGECQEELVS